MKNPEEKAPEFFCRPLARYLAECCHAVNRGDALTLDLGNVELRVIPGDSVELPHFDPPVDAIVVFAGSNDLRDWMRNVATRLRACAVRGGRVHAGFERDFLAVRERLLDALRGAARVGIAGHSRAHPLACRLAEELHASGMEVPFVITFGGPRWCDAARRDRYNALRIPTHRFVVGWDAVPRWPKGAYRHVGAMICLDAGGKRLQAQRRPPWWAPWRYLSDAVRDHVVGEDYARALDAWTNVSG